MYEVKPFTCGDISTHIRIYDMVLDWLHNMTFDTETFKFLDLRRYFHKSFGLFPSFRQVCF